MKIALMIAWIGLLTTTALAQLPATGSEPRITFMLRNTLGYHRMFLVEGPGIKYGFTMGRRETVPCNWPIGSKLYFTKDGETAQGLIFTVRAEDEGKTLGTDASGSGPKEMATRPTALEKKSEIMFRLRNPSFLPKKIAVITYEPGGTGNGTNISVVYPKTSIKFRFPVGTKVYLADNEQVNTVMSGKRIDSNKPFLIIKEADAGKTFDIFE